MTSPDGILVVTAELSPVPKPENEAERLATLRSLQLVGKPSLPELDDLTVLASHICEVPIALVTLVESEYQWFGAKVGVNDICGTPRDMAFCAHAIRQPNIFVVPDALKDERFARNPLVTAPPHIRFYAGVPLITQEGHALGTLCVIDRMPRTLTPKQEVALRVLGRQVVTQLELRRSHGRLQKAEQALQAANARLELRVAERTGELETAHGRLGLAISAAKVGWWEWNLTEDQLYHSPESAAQLGYRAGEMPKNWLEWRKFIHPEDLPAANGAFAKYMDDPRGDYECELRVRHADGSDRWVLTRARLYRGKDGQPDRMFGCHLDITERRVMEENLRTSRGQLRALAAHLHTAREEESGRIARELHDELGSTLSGLKLDMGWLDRQVAKLLPLAEGEPLRERLRLLAQQVDGTIVSVRKVCRDLRPAVLDELGLAAGLDWLVSEFETRTGLPCGVCRPEVIEIEPTLAIAVYRITQELLTNIGRHAEAQTVYLSMTRNDGSWVLEVVDDGRGLPPDALTRRDHFGLVGLQERVLGAGGEAEFGPGPQGGTRVRVTLPTTFPSPMP